jgi:hypothetical protein
LQSQATKLTPEAISDLDSTLGASLKRAGVLGGYAVFWVSNPGGYSIGVVFRDAAGAAAGLKALRNSEARNWHESYDGRSAAIATTTFGDESWGLRLTSANRRVLKGAEFGWRRANLVIASSIQCLDSCRGRRYDFIGAARRYTALLDAKARQVQTR